MSSIAIVTDSSAYLPQELVARHRVHVVPVYVHYDEEIFRDGVDLDADAFYDKLKRASDLPTTSQPSAGDFLNLYRRLGNQADSILSIHISSELSGTVASALAARQLLQEEAVEGGQDPPDIHVIDTLSTSGGLGLLVTAAARMVESGSSAQEVVETCKDTIPRTNVIFVVDTLEYLRKGGRIGGAAALLGSVVQLKPVLCLTQGRIEVLERVRTAKKAKARLLKILEEYSEAKEPLHVSIIHADAHNEAEKLRQTIKDRFNTTELFVSELSPAIGTHTGPGTVGLAFIK